jgi:hypothetical protein
MNAFVRFLVLVCVLLSVAIGGAPTPVSAGQSVLEILETQCQNESTITTLQKRVDELDAVQDSRLYVTHRTLALEYFRCSESSAPSGVRDLAALCYANELQESVETDSDELRLGTKAAYELNELAVRTQSGWIRNMALHDRDAIRHLIAGARSSLLSH